MKASKILFQMANGQVRSFTFDEFPKANVNDLAKLGVTMDEADLGVRAAMDAAPTLITTGSVATPIQFLQYWMQGMISVVTAARKADDILGRSIVGSWDDDEIVYTVKENAGKPQPYGDFTDVPLVSYNTNFVRRTNVRFELGIQTGKLEDARASRMRVNPYNEKRASASEAVAIELNRIAFNGYDSYNSSTNPSGGLTYGLLNDPNMPSATAFAANAAVSSTNWSAKTYLEICRDFMTAMQALRTKSGDLFDPEKNGVTIAVASAVYEYLSTQNEHGNKSVRQWIAETYKGAKLVSTPELDNAGGSGVHHVFFIADSIGGKKCADQLVTSTLRLLGIEPKIKGTLEGYTFSTAGAVVSQPVGVVRYSGC